MKNSDRPTTISSGQSKASRFLKKNAKPAPLLPSADVGVRATQDK